MWVEMQILCHDAGDAARHPPREDVSWNTSSIPLAYTDIVILLVRMWVEIASALPAVWLAVVILLVRMWVEMLLYTLGISQQSSHPPREDVSWNIAIYRWNITTKVILLVRMWVEILKMKEIYQNYPVILLVRMWVEILIIITYRIHPLVILLVRMWVEIFGKVIYWLSESSSSSWGCELK